MQERGREAHQCFWVAAKMGETLLKSVVRKTEKTDNTVFRVAGGAYVKAADQRARVRDWAKGESFARTLQLNFIQYALEK